MGWREGEDLLVCTCMRVRAWNGVCARGMGGYSGDRTGLVRFFQRVVVRWRKRVGRRRLPPPLLIPYPVCTARIRAGKRRDACRRLHSAGPDAHQVVRSRSGQTVRPQRYCALFLSFSLSLAPSLVLTPCPVLLSTPLSLSYPPSLLACVVLSHSFVSAYLYVHTSISLLGALQQSAAAEGRSSVNCPRWTR